MEEQDLRKIIASDFADNWLQVAMNDEESYRYLQEDKELEVAALSKKLSDEWEDLVQTVIELVEDKISESASLFIAQILGNQGSLPFDIIAREIKSE